MGDDSEPNSPKNAPQTDPTPSNPSPSASSGQVSFWAEVKRRRVVRVAITYAVVAWLIMQVAALTFEGFGIPEWAFRFVVLMLVVFFPVAIVLAWAFELTPDGVKTTKSLREQQDREPVSAKEQSQRNLRAIAFAAALPTLIFGALAVFFYFRAGPSESELSTHHPVSADQRGDGSPLSTELEKSIAVLPLDNLSPDPENAFFADGVQEDILTNLSKIEELIVISRSSTLRYRERVQSLKQIGAELDVRYVVEGSVRRAANRVLVTVQLIEVETDAHLWAENFNRPLDDIFAIQAEIAKTIAGQLHAVISPETTAKIEYRPTENQEAYDLFLQHRRMIETQLRMWDQKAALLEQAVALDPNFAEAWAHLSIEYRVWWRNSDYTPSDRDPELLAKAEAALDKAKGLKPDIAYIPYAQYVFAEDVDEKISLLLKALSLDPSFSLAKGALSYTYSRLGRLAEAQHHREALYRSDPLDEITAWSLALTYRDQQMWDEALGVIEKAKERKLEDEEDSNLIWEQLFLNTVYLRYGDRASYQDGLRALTGFEDDPQLVAWHALVSRDLDSLLDAAGDGTINFGEISILSHFEARYLTLHGIGRLERNPNLLQGALDWINNDLEEKPEGDGWTFGAKTIFMAFTGDRSKVEAAAAQAREYNETAPNQDPLYRAVIEIKIAMAYVVLGDHEKAIETLEAASKMPSRIPLNRHLDLWFVFDELRGNARFDALL